MSVENLYSMRACEMEIINHDRSEKDLWNRVKPISYVLTIYVGFFFHNTVGLRLVPRKQNTRLVGATFLYGRVYNILNR